MKKEEERQERLREWERYTQEEENKRKIQQQLEEKRLKEEHEREAQEYRKYLEEKQRIEQEAVKKREEMAELSNVLLRNVKEYCSSIVSESKDPWTKKLSYFEKRRVIGGAQEILNWIKYNTDIEPKEIETKISSFRSDVDPIILKAKNQIKLEESTAEFDTIDFDFEVFADADKVIDMSIIKIQPPTKPKLDESFDVSMKTKRSFKTWSHQLGNKENKKKRGAIRRFSHGYHPDKSAGNEKASKKSKGISEDYEVL